MTMFKDMAVTVLVMFALGLSGCAATFKDDFDLEQIKPLAVSKDIADALKNRKGLEVCMGGVTFYDSGPLHQILKEGKVKEGAFHFRNFPPLLHPDQMTRDIFGKFREVLPSVLAGTGFNVASACNEKLVRVGVAFAFLFKDAPRPQTMVMWSGLDFFYKNDLVLMTGTGWQGRLDAWEILPRGVSGLIDYAGKKHMREIEILWPKTFVPPPDPQKK